MNKERYRGGVHTVMRQFLDLMCINTQSNLQALAINSMNLLKNANG